MGYKFNAIEGTFDVDSNLILTNPLQFKGIINSNTDFPLIADVENGWFYTITTDVTDNAGVTYTNTGQSFKIGDEIAWNGTDWTIMGNENIFLLIDGTRAMTGALNMGTNLINNVVDPVDNQDAATKKFVDDLTINHPHQDVKTTASPTFVNGTYTGALEVTGEIASDLRVQATNAYGTTAITGHTFTMGRNGQNYITASQAYGAFHFRPGGGGDKMIITYDGKVGIGANPTYPLVVKHATNNTLLALQSDDANAGMKLIDSTKEVDIENRAGKLLIFTNSGANNPFIFHEDKLSIGRPYTHTPSASLEVDGNIKIYGTNDILYFVNTGENIRSPSAGIMSYETRGLQRVMTDTNNNDPATAESFSIYTGDTYAGGTGTQLLKVLKNKELQIGGHINCDGLCVLDAGFVGTAWKIAGTTYMYNYVDTTNRWNNLAIGDNVGNQLVITNEANRNKDHDHNPTTDPTLFIHSDTNPDNANDEWISMTHDKTNGRLLTGSGAVEIEQSSFPVAKIIRTSVGTNAVSSAFEVNGITTNNMLDGFGTGIVFSLQDDTSAENNVARIAAVRDGADNTGALVFYTGGLIEKIRIDKDGTLRTDGITPSDLNIDCGTNKTLELQQTVWDDQQVNIAAVKLGSSAPTWTDYKGAKVLAFSKSQDNSLSFNLQLSHKYKLNSNIEFHLHNTPSDDTAGDVRWTLSVSMVDINGDFPAPTTYTAVQTVDANTGDKHILFEIDDNIGNFAGVSAVGLLTLTRTGTHEDDDYDNDIYLTALDSHFEVNTMGSRQEATK